MTTTEKNTAIQGLKDIQQQIESFEADWVKADKAGKREEADRLDRRIELLLAMRHGMEKMLTALEIEYDRKDYRTVDLNGDWTVHTMWYLI